MKEILLFGAGKSATVLIDYLLGHAAAEKWRLILVDADLDLATAKLSGSPHGEALRFDITSDDKRDAAVQRADLVISMLPPALHRLVAASCLEYGRHLLTASYVDDQLRAMSSEVMAKNIIFLCEMGLDPGIDHMSAMQLIHSIRERGGKISSFRSHCGGLIAPESDNNPWHYKISWNPRNIVMAGSSGAVFKQDHKVVRIEYPLLFEGNNTVTVPGQGDYSFYANRDSLGYMGLYGLEDTAHFLRTTLRHPDFMVAWNYVVKAGLTNEQAFNHPAIGPSYHEWLDQQLLNHTGATGFAAFLDLIPDLSEASLVKHLFAWLGLTGNELIPATARCNADVLQFAMEGKLQLLPGDRDMIVMLHEFVYTLDKNQQHINSSLVVKGTDSRHTAMAKTVGLPLGIAARLILNGTINRRGVCIPVHEDIYVPVLAELARHGVVFQETSDQ